MHSLQDETYLLRHRLNQKLKRVRDSAHYRAALTLSIYSILPVFFFNFGSVSAAPIHITSPDYKVLIKPVALMPPLKPVAIPPAPPTIQPIVIPPPAPPPPPVAPAPVVGCGSDPQMAYIYQVESGCNTAAVNPGGCRGLGQACPGSKLPCSDYDWACQDNWFRTYAVSAYGSIYNAYLFRTSHNYW